MWSVGRKRGRLYLGSRVALLQVTGYALLTLEHAPRLPLAAVLLQLALKSQQQGIDLSKTMLNVDLSAIFCKGAVYPPNFTPNHTFTLSSDLQQMLAAQLPWPPEHWEWPGSAATFEVLPITTQGIVRNLRQWMEAQQIKISIVQPLWALVTQSSRASSKAIKAVVLKEPDGMTVFAENRRSLSSSQPASWKFLHAEEVEAHPQSLEDAVTALKLRKNEVAVFEFHSQPNFEQKIGLKAWAGHWVCT